MWVHGTLQKIAALSHMNKARLYFSPLHFSLENTSVIGYKQGAVGFPQPKHLPLLTANFPVTVCMVTLMCVIPVVCVNQIWQI